MQTTNTTDLRKNLKDKLEIVSENKEILIIHRAGQEDVVMMTLSEFNSLTETNYLLSTENNRNNLDKSIKEISKGQTTEINVNDLWS